MMEISDRSLKPQDYIRALEQEKKKIEMFQRELPLCLQLVSQAIENLRSVGGSDEAMIEAAATPPVLAEFLPLKPSLSASSDDGEVGTPASRPDQKPDWLRSVQLWNQDPDPPRMEPPTRPIAVSAKKIGGAFQPFEREKHGAAVTAVAPAVVELSAAATSSSTSTEGFGGSGDNIVKETREEKENKEGQSLQSQILTNRKARRCWSPELHRRFLQALQQLGGSHAATPKQIRELMKVDGLTNDEVKSHLQKYRLHTRRPSPAVQSNNNATAQAPQFVVVGGIWVPPPDYAAAVAAAQTTNTPSVQNEIYAPVASHPVRTQPKQNHQVKKQPQRSPTGPLASDGRCSDDNNSLREDDDTVISGSRTSSSASQTTTASPPS